MLEIRDDQFLILECETESIEMYQMKIFYYRTIAGIKAFRFSMTEKRSYLYYPEKNKTSLVDLVEQNLSNKELLRILEQIRLIIRESKNNLLYERNFALRPEWIYIDKCMDQMKVELVYMPLKQGQKPILEENYRSFVRFISKLFNEWNEMEYFYYFKRLDEEKYDDQSMEELLKVLEQLSKEKIHQ
jgi:tRNA/tmRNA/rRNA uracil-C5-methylase (TrmA/RlmC/RlmD family)